jgi:vitamin B12 transporter
MWRMQAELAHREGESECLRANYTYQKAQDKTDKTDTYYGGQIPYIPWHSGFGHCRLKRLSGLGCQLQLHLHRASATKLSANIPENYEQPWYTSDFSLSRKHSCFGNGVHCELTAEVNNIFNQQYEVVQCYPMPGTNFKIKLNIYHMKQKHSRYTVITVRFLPHVLYRFLP